MEGRMEVKALYVHNPKTAGKTIYRSLHPEITRLYELTNKVPKHCTAAWILSYYKGNVPFPMISSTRNPWERAVSLYKYLQTINKLHPSIKFSDWIRNPQAPDHCIDPLERNPLQLETFVTDGYGQVIVDHILRLEYLEEDVSKVAEQLGVKRELETFNSTFNGKGKSYQSFYTQEDREYIQDLCEWEISTFEYSF